MMPLTCRGNCWYSHLPTTLAIYMPCVVALCVIVRCCCCCCCCCVMYFSIPSPLLLPLPPSSTSFYPPPFGIFNRPTNILFSAGPCSCRAAALHKRCVLAVDSTGISRRAQAGGGALDSWSQPAAASAAAPPASSSCSWEGCGGGLLWATWRPPGAGSCSPPTAAAGRSSSQRRRRRRRLRLGQGRRAGRQRAGRGLRPAAWPAAEEGDRGKGAVAAAEARALFQTGSDTVTRRLQPC